MDRRHRALALIAASVIAFAFVPLVQAAGTLVQKQEAFSLGGPAPRWEVKLRPKAPVTVAVGAPIDAKLNVGETFSSVTLVCFEFQFEADLLDPGEGLLMNVDPLGFAFGLVNVGGHR